MAKVTWRSWAGIVIATFLASASLAQVAVPPPAEPEYQGLFKYFHDGKALSASEQLKIGLLVGDLNRTFVLIAGVDDYPQLSPVDKRQLPAVQKDIQNLINYFKGDGFADEVVLLHNADFTLDNLNYFLQTYFPARLRKYPKSRFVFAFSGHGFREGDKGYVLTSQARNLGDKARSVELTMLRVMFDDVVSSAHQTLILINSCYGGSFFRPALGGARYVPKEPGAHAITAGGSTELAWADPTVGPGTVFFESFLRGVEGLADSPSAPGKPGDGVVTLEELFSYLRNEVQISTDQKQNPQMDNIKVGGSTGSFFFLTPSFQTMAVSLPQTTASTGQALGISTPITPADFWVQLYGDDVTSGKSSAEYRLNFGGVTAGETHHATLEVTNQSVNSRELKIVPGLTSLNAYWKAGPKQLNSINLAPGGVGLLVVSLIASSGSEAKIGVSSDGTEVFSVRAVFEVREKELTVSRSSGLKPSGAGKGWASHQLCAETPPGYERIDGSVNFSLTGDRACGAWSECNVIRKDPANVCFEFKLQGHEEGPGDGVRMSEGHIQARYRLSTQKVSLE